METFVNFDDMSIPDLTKVINGLLHDRLMKIREAEIKIKIDRQFLEHVIGIFDKKWEIVVKQMFPDINMGKSTMQLYAECIKQEDEKIEEDRIAIEKMKNLHDQREINGDFVDNLENEKLWNEQMDIKLADVLRCENLSMHDYGDIND